MRIVFVTDQLQNGGAERETAAFANELAELGQEVHIACFRDMASDYEIDPRIRLHRLLLVSRVNIPKVRVWFRWRRTLLELRNLRGDIILPISLPLSYFTCLWFAAFLSGAKILYVVRNNPEKRYTAKRENRRWKRAARRADGIWLQTEEQRIFFPESYAKKIFVVPNILTQRFLQIQRQERKAVFRFISVGRIHAQKNQKMLIEAFAKMAESTADPCTTLVIYGKALPECCQLEEELRSLIHKYHLEERIFLPGRIQEIEQCYAEADAFVFSSDYEGLPNALMEAMAAGLPCISTDCPTGPSTLITSGENGLLVPVGDVEAMARAMEYFVNHPQEASRMGAAARKKMQDWESQEELAGKLLENLRRICK